MKTALRIISLLLLGLFCIEANAAVMAPSGGMTRATRSFSSNRSASRVPTSSSVTSTLNTMFRNGSVGLSLARPVSGSPPGAQFNLVGSPTVFPSGTVNGTISSSFSGPNGNRSSNTNFSSPFFTNGSNFQLPNGTTFPNGTFPVAPGLSTPFTTGFNSPFSSGAFNPSGAPGFFGDDGDDASDGGPPETPLSTVLKGEASVIGASAAYNQATAAAAVNATQAESNAMKNSVDRVRTYYGTRDAGGAAAQCRARSSAGRHRTHSHRPCSRAARSEHEPNRPGIRRDSLARFLAGFAFRKPAGSD